MARGRQLVWITPVHFDHQGRPVDPDYGIDEGGHPDQGLPGGFPGFPDRPGHLPSRPGRPIDPGFGWGGGEHPGNRPPGSWGGRPVDPGYGVEGGGEAGHLPVFPVDPEHPEVMPPMVPPGIPELPPGSIWPPLPPSIPPGKAVVAIYISGVGSRWAVVDIPERPEGPEVEPPEGGEYPDQGLPGGGRPTRPPARPPTAGQPLPPTRPGIPPRPGQGLPPTPPQRPEPKR
jgi:hypothetical protein